MTIQNMIEDLRLMTKASNASPRGANNRLRWEIRQRDATIDRLLVKIEYLETDLRAERTMAQSIARRQSYGAAS